MWSTTEPEALQKPSIKIFSSPSLKPDVRLKVFDTEFHVHSIILKLNSAFFRKFLDSPDKKLPESPPAPFRYEWVTKVDEGGLGWCLVAAGGEQTTASNIEFAKNRSFETATFEKLLCAMYGHPYHFRFEDRELDGCYGLRNLTTLADYYCALPVVSRSLYAPLIAADYMMSALRFYPLNYLEIFEKLRNPVFFRQAALWAINPWHDPVFKSANVTLTLTPQLVKSLSNMHNEIGAIIGEIELLIRRFSRKYLKFKSTIDTIETPITDDDEDIFPEFYLRAKRINWRSIMTRRRNVDSPDASKFMALLDKLTANKLEINLTGLGNLDHDLRDFFLCVRIKDEDLPWDTTEKDW